MILPLINHLFFMTFVVILLERSKPQGSAEDHSYQQKQIPPFVPCSTKQTNRFILRRRPSQEDETEMMTPGYVRLYATGELDRRICQAQEKMRSCTICPHHCGVDRLAGEKGICGVKALAPVCSSGPHFGEEAPLTGKHGSGTIFFGGCNLLCSFCQNFELSHYQEDSCNALQPEELADVMVSLQEQGCHNINLVTPSHVVPQVLAALPSAIGKGLRLPLVFNSSGYEEREALELLNGVIDIYMPDFKFWKNDTAKKYTKAENYGDKTRQSLCLMQQQVGDLVTDEDGIAKRGLIVRHLVMPGLLEESRSILYFLATSVSATCHVNIMNQYRPLGEAEAPIDRPLTGEEYQRALEIAGPTELVQLNALGIEDLLRKLGIVP